MTRILTLVRMGFLLVLLVGCTGATSASTPAPKPSTLASVTPTVLPAVLPTLPVTSDLPSAPPVVISPTSPPITKSPAPIAPVITEARVAVGTEPTVSVNPVTGEIAVVMQEIPWPKMCSRSVVYVSHNQGKTWASAGRPWGSGCQDIHAVVAWGPNNRLWAGNAVGASGGVKMSVSYTDNDGKSWAKPYVQPWTRAWVGCFPMITVDNDPASANYGTVYAAYNWRPNSSGPGLHVMAKTLTGGWTAVEVPVVGLKGYAAHNRIGYRLATVNGGLVVSWYESDLRVFPADILSDGSASNVGRRGFAVANLNWVAGKLTVQQVEWAGSVAGNNKLILDPRWQSQLAIDEGETFLVVENGGWVSLGHRTATGWVWQRLASGFKPTLAASDTGVLMVGFHKAAGAIVRNYYLLSYDHGLTWTAAQFIDGAKYRLPNVINGTGLRENAVFGGDDGAFYWAWGDTRSGATAIIVARIMP